MPGERPPFRGDIEGLRGVAVLLVVLYHAGVPGFTGGYVGVDVFFALSGYLITAILVSEVERTGRIDFARFYARRARRLLPASAALLLSVAAFARLFYSPLEQEGIARTALSVSLYVSNLSFGRKATDYLGAEAEANPLLHTWSLAVEEQFYLVWPLLVLVGLVGLPWLRRGRLALSPRRLAWVMVGVTAVTLGLTVYLMGTLQTHWAFFASPPRAWEFAVGGLGAVLPRLRLASSRVAVGAHVLGWLGLAAVVAAGALYTSQTPFPGWAALAPVVGTVLALRAGVGQQATALSRVLGWRPLQEAGRLSYSWYLWHWPVLVFAEGLYGAGAGGHLSLPVRLGLLLVSLVLAEGSYRFVEDPVRHHRGLARRPANGLMLLAALTLCGAGLSAAWKAYATAESLSPTYARFTEARDDLPDVYDSGCHAAMEDAEAVGCESGSEEAPVSVALYGDSHAAHWQPALQRAAEENGWRVLTLTKSSCSFVEVTTYSRALGRDYAECDQWRASALKRLTAFSPDVVLTSSSSGYPLTPDEWSWGSRQAFGRLAALDGVVVNIRDVPQPRVEVPGCLARAVSAPWPTARAPWRTDGGPCDFPKSPHRNEAAREAQEAAAALFPGVLDVSADDAICPGRLCRAEVDGAIRYRDDHHLTATFSRSLAPFLSATVRDALSRSKPRGPPVIPVEEAP